MAEIDPYLVLGVTRTATRAEIARAYRALAKRHHPDAGAPQSAEMARINEAWHTLSDVNRRSRWDRLHERPIVAEPHWSPASRVAEPVRRPPPQPAAPPSALDSGWTAAIVVLGALVLVGGLMAAISFAAAPADDRVRFEDPAISFLTPPDWVVAAGDPTDPPAHRVVAHLVTYALDPDRLCTSFGKVCSLARDDIPSGQASIVVTAYTGGTPPVPDPVISRPFGLDADALIDGKPAAFEQEVVDERTTRLWWQLSPPGFPDRWIEISAVVRGLSLDQSDVIGEITAFLETIELPD